VMPSSIDRHVVAVVPPAQATAQLALADSARRLQVVTKCLIPHLSTLDRVHAFTGRAEEAGVNTYPSDAPLCPRPRHLRGRSSQSLWGRLARMLLVATMTTTADAAACRAICSRVTCNLTSSLPRGVYLLRPAGPIERGSIVSLVAPSPCAGSSPSDGTCHLPSIF